MLSLMYQFDNSKTFKALTSKDNCDKFSQIKKLKIYVTQYFKFAQHLI